MKSGVLENVNLFKGFTLNFVIPLFHTGHESPELPRIDFLLIRGDS